MAQNQLLSVFSQFVPANTGTAGQVLTSGGSGANTYWSTVSGGGGFTNGQSISVANLVITGSLTANSSNGTTGQVLTSNSTGVYWATAASAVTAVRQQYTGDGTTTSFTVSGGYTANSISVFLNGVMLRNGTEITVTSGTSVVFANAPPSGALIDVIGTLTAGGSGGGSASINTIDGGTSTTVFDTVDTIIEGGGA